MAADVADLSQEGARLLRERAKLWSVWSRLLPRPTINLRLSQSVAKSLITSNHDVATVRQPFPCTSGVKVIQLEQCDC